MKKLLLCILCSTIVTTFIGSTIMVIYFLPNYFISNVSMQTDLEDSTFLVESLDAYKDYEENWENINIIINQLKSTYGEDYPVVGLMLHSFVNHYSNMFVNAYLISIFLGIILGIFIYLIFIQKVTSKHIELKIGLAFIIILIIIPLINWAYTIFCNKFVISTDTYVEFSLFEYDLDSPMLLGISLGIFFLVLLSNLIFQKIKTHKLNKALEERK